jgi:hypothetical protein
MLICFHFERAGTIPAQQHVVTLQEKRYSTLTPMVAAMRSDILYIIMSIAIYWASLFPALIADQTPQIHRGLLLLVTVFLSTNTVSIKRLLHETSSFSFIFSS